MKKALTTALLSVILLAACGTTPSSSVTDVPQAVESVTPLSIQSTSTPFQPATRIPQPTSTPFSHPTEPEKTLTPLPNETQISSTATTAARKAEYATMRAPFPECVYVDSTMKSPDNYWTVAACEPKAVLKGQNGETIEISSESFSTFFPSETQYMDLRALPEYWSADSQFFYFSANTYLGDGCGCFCYRDGVALFRLEIASRKIVPILINLGSGYGVFSFAFAPNGRRLAYVIDRTNKLVMRDLRTGQENSIDFSEYTEVGNLVWSPDSQKLAIGMALCPETSYPIFKLGVIRMGKELSPQIVLAKTGETDWGNYYWSIDAWQDDNTLIISNDCNIQEKVKFIDLKP